MKWKKGKTTARNERRYIKQMQTGEWDYKSDGMNSLKYELVEIEEISPKAKDDKCKIMSKILIAYDLVGPNGYIPYTYDKDTISSIMEKELREIHNRDYFQNIEKVSTHQLIHQLKYNDSNIYI